MPVRRFFTALLMTLVATVALAQDKVACHFDNSDAQAIPRLRTLRNCLDTAPNTTINAVSVGDGVNVLVDTPKTSKTPTSSTAR